MDTKYDTVLEISSQGLTEYTIETIGLLHAEQVDDHDTVRKKSATGHVNGGTDIYSASNVFKGIGFGAIGDYTLRRNGQEIDPFHLQARELVIESDVDKAPYKLSVSGRLIGTGQTDDTETLSGDGTRATGRVRASGRDVWHYTGLLEGIDTNQDLDVWIDGEHREIPGNTPIGLVAYDG